MKQFFILNAIIGALLLCHNAIAQFEKTYTPRKVYSRSSVNLISQIKYQLETEPTSPEDPLYKATLQKFNAARINFLTGMVKAKHFIQDDSLENYVRTILDNIILNNSIQSRPRMVLISKNSYVNAMCYGNGIYIITIAMLGRVNSEDQVAFALAHELAHDELDHIRSKVINLQKADLEKKSLEQFKKINKGNVTEDDFTSFRQVIYNLSKYNREKELEADSLALILLQNAGYDKQESISLLSILNNSMGLKYDIGEELFMPLHSSEYPFQIGWLNNRLSLYSKTDRSSFMYSTDSLRTHPDIEYRIQTLKKEQVPLIYGANYKPWSFTNSVTTIAEFETIESAYDNKQYDICLFYALQLLNKFPHNNYIITKIGKILVELFQARDNYGFGYYVSRYTSHYNEELQLVNNFLFNLSTKELGEVAFFFLKNKKYFDENEKDHYALLMKISLLTYRNDFANVLKKQYKVRFNENLSDYKYK